MNINTPLSHLRSEAQRVHIDAVCSPLFDHYNVKLDLLRLDLIHPLVSGNKWFKLLGQLDSIDLDLPVISFGGAHSNHLHALGYASSRLGFKAIAIVRGEENETPTLRDLRNWGVQLHFVSRETYRQRADRAYLESLAHKFGPHTLIPEGGSNSAAVTGCSEIWQLAALAKSPPDYLVCAVGSGGTLAGLIKGKPPQVLIQGVSALSDCADLQERVTQLLQTEMNESVSIEPSLRLRYGRVNAELSALAEQFKAKTGVELDAIYTLRVLHFITRRLIAGGYPPGTRIMMVHTGGLQGNRAQQDRISRLASAFCGPLVL